MYALNDLKDIIQAGYDRLKSTPDPVDLSRNRGNVAQNAAEQIPVAPIDNSKIVTLNDIAATARASGRTTSEVTAALKAKGYKIGGK